MAKTRRAIGLKITLIIAASVLIFSAVSVGYSYFYLLDPLRNSVMDSRVKMAELAANSITILLEKQAELVNTNSSAEYMKEAVMRANAKYQGMDAEGARRYLLDINKKWLKAGKSGDTIPISPEVDKG
ncbi:MAG: hypothetical protein Q8N91_04785 [Candidatus Omnitrophota bacterium]|nr:hypothetical protein [Candidatus Omnitrophota bacterium]